MPVWLARSRCPYPRTRLAEICHGHQQRGRSDERGTKLPCPPGPLPPRAQDGSGFRRKRPLLGVQNERGDRIVSLEICEHVSGCLADPERQLAHREQDELPARAPRLGVSGVSVIVSAARWIWHPATTKTNRPRSKAVMARATSRSASSSLALARASLRVSSSSEMATLPGAPAPRAGRRSPSNSKPGERPTPRPAATHVRA